MAKRWGLTFEEWNAEYFGTGSRTEEAIKNIRAIWDATLERAALSFEYVCNDGTTVDNDLVMAKVQHDVQDGFVKRRRQQLVGLTLVVAFRCWSYVHCWILWIIRSGHSIVTRIGIQRPLMRQIVCPLLDRAAASFAQRAGIKECSVDIPSVPVSFSARWFFETTPFVQNSQTGQSVAVLFIHGGAFQVHTATEHLVAAQLLLRLEGVPPLLAPAYRLQPEVSHEQQLYECLENFKYLVDCGFRDIVVMGDSAGGNLALATTLRLMKDERSTLFRHVAAVVLISPWLDVHSWKSSRRRRSLDMLSPAFLRESAGPYDGPDLAYFCSAVKSAGDELPPTLCVAGGNEVLLEDSRALAAASPRVRLCVGEGEPHDFLMTPLICSRPTAAHMAWCEVSAFLQRALRLRQKAK
eukprot:TRINITY_DN47806_c0_g1_i1.p1 TRINITY_DN47806_c0_g1~~TRINITY_DN47806_c0_g1_i1.p1  ORF type:complete len:447 (+),score=99.04 TRINITY_DN47806_c0_g1_i1:116-1342(+)